MKHGSYIWAVFFLVGYESTAQESNIDDYNENMIFIQTGARPNDRPSFPNQEYEKQVSVWIEFIRLQKEGMISSVFDIHGLDECDLSKNIKNKILGYEDTTKNIEVDLLTQINIDAEGGGSKDNTRNNTQTSVYSTKAICNNISSGKPLVDARVVVLSDEVEPSAVGEHRKTSTSYLYIGAFDENLMLMEKSSMLMASNISHNPEGAFNVWELTYTVKNTTYDHVKFMAGTPYAIEPSLNLDEVIRSIYSNRSNNNRVEEKTFYGSNLIVVNRFLNDRAHGLQESFTRDVGYKYFCYENGSKVIIPKNDCEKL